MLRESGSRNMYAKYQISGALTFSQQLQKTVSSHVCKSHQNHPPAAQREGSQHCTAGREGGYSRCVGPPQMC